MSDLTLSADQQRAYEAFCQLVQDPMQTVLVIEGYAGTGKSTLINKCVQDLPKLIKTMRLLQIKAPAYQLYLTATTNKAVDTLRGIVGMEAQTIYSLLGLRMQTNYEDMSVRIALGRNARVVEDAVIFIDEASLVNYDLLRYIFKQTRRCKLVFVGDPAQLIDHKTKAAPVFARDYPRVSLTEVVRQAAGSPVLELATAFRNTVSTGEFFQFTPDNQHVFHMGRTDFDQAVIDEFTRPDWQEAASRVLAWTNKRVIAYNKGIYKLVKGKTKFQPGDYAVCNRYVRNNAQCIKTDQMVCVSSIKPGRELGVSGYHVQVDHGNTVFFLPEDQEDRKKALKSAQLKRDQSMARLVDETWVDLRAAYASTINKSQGSTFDRVFIDLDDLKRCNNGNQLARLLFVAVSRARNQVYFTGDLV